MNNELVQTLRSIRNILLLGVLFLGLTAASSVYFAWDIANNNRLEQAARGFRMQADTLINNQDYDALIIQSQARQKSHPHDADALFYEGMARYHKGEYSDSIPLFTKAAQVAGTKGARQSSDNWIKAAKKELDGAAKN